MPRTSDLRNRIITKVFEEPTISRHDLARVLGVKYSSVQKHLAQLARTGEVVPGFVVRESSLLKRQKFWIFVETRFTPPEASTDEKQKVVPYQQELCRTIVDAVLKKPWSDTISYGGIQIMLGGSADLVLTLYTNDAASISRFVTDFLRTRPSIVRTSTAWAAVDPSDSARPG
ncbi:MAG: hypothetical protein IT436_09605 [Phycisphaerales bacterium]|nr:hypothetical protein [Phycisphaerales bacterium]